MSDYPEQLKYTKDHEWLRVEDDGTATVGITFHAQESLGDITFVELPSVDERFGVGDTFGVVESVKAASDLFLPVTGKVVAINDGLEDEPETVNQDPYGKGWMVRLSLDDPQEVQQLLSAADYQALL
ncbi:MAG: glycine cleavage system protein GcvH [Opitutales bacterium]